MAWTLRHPPLDGRGNGKERDGHLNPIAGKTDQPKITHVVKKMKGEGIKTDKLVLTA